MNEPLDKSPTPTALDRVVPALGLASFAVILFGFKLLVIGAYGNATPYWDQWAGEAKLLYAPFLEGHLEWSHMLAAHNEHRILLPRLLSLGLLSVNGVWNPLLQMVVNAGLHVGLVCLLASLLTRVVGRDYLPAILMFCLVLFSGPYGWENTLAGFQSCFYFVLLFSIGSIWLVIGAAPFSARWWAGTGLSICGFFSLASGVFAPAALAGIGTLQYLTGTRTGRLHIASVLALGCLFVLGVFLTPNCAEHAPLKAATLTQLFFSLNRVLGWPLQGDIVGPLLRNAPALLFTAIMLRTPPPADDRRWFLLALLLWMFGQDVAVAHGRAVHPVASRYMDLFAIDVLANFACLFSVVPRHPVQLRWSVPVAAAWTVIVLGCLGGLVHRQGRQDLQHRLETARAQELNTRNYVHTGDMRHLTDKPFLHVPYPRPEHLAAFLDTPSIRTILPRAIGAPMEGESSGNATSDACFVDGHGPGVPVPTTQTWGTYGPAGATATGRASITFPAAHRGHCVEIPVAGQSHAEGITLEIEQDGKRRRLHPAGDREDAWGSATAKVRGRPFTLHITDMSAEAWLAVGRPVAVGRWDARVDKLLARWDVFVIMGSVTVVALLTFISLARPASIM
jgi:hypothetical protein